MLQVRDAVHRTSSCHNEQSLNSARLQVRRSTDDGVASYEIYVLATGMTKDDVKYAARTGVLHEGWLLLPHRHRSWMWVGEPM
jgi:hypothetical protein